MSNSPVLFQKLDQVVPQLGRLGVDPERFSRIVRTELQAKPQLKKCTPDSFLAAVFAAAQLGLEPGAKLGHFYLTPRRIKGQWQVVPIVGYRGYIELAWRDDIVVTAKIVYEGDKFHHEEGTRPRITHRPVTDPDRRGRSVAWYAIGHYPDGRTTQAVLRRPDVEARRARSATPDDGPWVTDYDAMARKSAVRALWGQLPMSPTVARGAAMDDRILTLPAQLASGPDVEVLSTGPDVDDEDTQEGSGQPAPPEADPASPHDGGPASEADQSGEGGHEPSSPVAPLSEGGASDKQILAIITLQKQREEDDHDLAELIRDQFDDLDAEDLDGLLNLLDEEQARQIIDRLNRRDDGEDDAGDGGGQ